MRWSVLVVEDDTLTRSLLVSVLRGHGVDVAVEAPTVTDALRSLGSHRPDAALLDLDLGPGPSGLDLAVELRSRDPQIGLVLLTSYDDVRLKDPSASMPRGVIHLSKKNGTDGTAVLAALQSAIAAPLSGLSDRSTVDLTTTQIEVLAGVARGESTAQIAQNRSVSTKAVEQVIARLCEILEVPRDAGTNQRVHLARRYHELTGRMP